MRHAASRASPDRNRYCRAGFLGRHQNNMRRAYAQDGTLAVTDSKSDAVGGAAIMERAGIPAERRVGGLGARQREQLLADFADK
jgi:hypothetical protein